LTYLLDQGNAATVWRLIFYEDNDTSKFFDYANKALRSRAFETHPLLDSESVGKRILPTNSKEIPEIGADFK